MPVGISIKADLKPLHRAMIALGAQQVPFAMSLALNDLARGVAAVEQDEINDTFDTPTPFTQKATRIVVATKSRPVATVAFKDVQAEYLAPYVFGGDRSLGTKRGMLAPRAVGLNQYGNLPKSKLASLRAKPNVYIGPIKTKSGRVINGVWQRPAKAKAAKGRRASGAQPRQGLKLLIQFEDTTPVRKRLPFEQAARRYIQRNAAAAFDAALRRALATARR
jgi:hypothetical protein|nr:hypothetical protein [uncultured Sphingomonas sp.]